MSRLRSFRFHVVTAAGASWRVTFYAVDLKTAMTYAAAWSRQHKVTVEPVHDDEVVA